MIHFEVTQSPDNEVLEKFQYFQNQIYLGSKRCNLNIRDKEIYETHLMIEVVENQLLVHPQKEVAFFLINGKRATNIRKINEFSIKMTR